MVKMSISQVSRSKDAARRNYDSLARWYDWLAGSEKRYRDIGLELLAAQKGESALEIGPGTGGGVLALAEFVGVDGHVFGLDLSPRMLAQTRIRVEKSGLGARISLLCGDGAHLPVKSASMDMLLMSFTLELFDTPEIPVVLAECRRVLRPSGRMCVVSLSREPAGWPVRLYEWCHERWPSAVDCRPIYVRQALEGAGFTMVKSKSEVMWGLPVEIVLANV
jgi:ubiquinone/menaquinone biosynthesis C-methylase UbiE